MGPHPQLSLIDGEPERLRPWITVAAMLLALALAGAGILVTRDVASLLATPVETSPGVGATVEPEPGSVGPADVGAAALPVQAPGQWDTWAVESAVAPRFSPLDDGRQLYMELDGGSAVLSVMPGVEIRSPQIDARVDGHPATIVRVPGSSVLHVIVAVGDGTVRLRSVDVTQDRSLEFLTAVVRSLGADLDNEPVLPPEVVLVSDRAKGSVREPAEVWNLASPDGAAYQVARIRISSPVLSRELEVEARLAGAVLLADGHPSLWFTPQMDNPSVGTLTWVEDGWRWSVSGARADGADAQSLVQTVPAVVKRG